MKIHRTRISPVVKWMGGKEQELKHIHPLMPDDFENYYEPFIGGGAVYLSVNTNKYFINDKYDQLVNYYNVIKTQDVEFFEVSERLILNWISLEIQVSQHNDFLYALFDKFTTNAITEKELKAHISIYVKDYSEYFTNLFVIDFPDTVDNFLIELNKSMFNKIKRMAKLEVTKGNLPKVDIIKNIEGSIKSAYFTHIRYLYNDMENYSIAKQTFLFFFIRNFAYCGMFRYNNDGKFNVPYGGVGYNRKNILKKLHQLKDVTLVNQLSKTTIENMDFEAFMDTHKPTENDFIFLDPPYDSTFSTYAMNEFDRNSQIRLADYMINQCPAKWLMVIKNTDFIFDLYNDKENVNICDFDKQYLVNFNNRNDRNVKHLVIRNYTLEAGLSKFME